MCLGSSHLFGVLENHDLGEVTLHILFLLMIFLCLSTMTTRRTSSRRIELEISNTGVPTKYNQALPREYSPQGDQAPVNPPAMPDGEIRLDLNFSAPALTTKD